MNSDKINKYINNIHENLKSYHEITEKDFYPPEDTRSYQSGIEDIDGGDNFSDYAKWFYNRYENDIFDN